MTFKGGRGHKAPYQTMMYRIPVPLKPFVEILAKMFRDYASINGTTDGWDEFLSEIMSGSSPNHVDIPKNYAEDLQENIKRLKDLMAQLEKSTRAK